MLEDVILEFPASLPCSKPSHFLRFLSKVRAMGSHFPTALKEVIISNYMDFSDVPLIHFGNFKSMDTLIYQNSGLWICDDLMRFSQFTSENVQNLVLMCAWEYPYMASTSKTPSLMSRDRWRGQNSSHYSERTYRTSHSWPPTLWNILMFGCH